MRRGREEELAMDLRDEAIHQAVSPQDMERVRELYRSFGLREIAGYYANPLPGVITLALDLPPAASA